MRKDEFMGLLNEGHERLVELSKGKGEEYSRDANQFANFERGAKDLGLIREQVLMVYLSKHMDSIKTIVQDLATGNYRQLSESPESRVDDAILYLFLLKGMFRETWPVEASPRPREAHSGGPVSMAVDVTTTAEAARRLAGMQTVADRIRAQGGPVIPVGSHVIDAATFDDPKKIIINGSSDVFVRQYYVKEGDKVTFHRVAQRDVPEWAEAFEMNIGMHPGPFYTPEELASIVTKWADETFGADRDENSTWKKLFEELGEVIRKPDDPTEWADVMILILDLAGRHKIELTPAILDKMEVLRGRAWEKKNGVYSHVDQA